MCLLHPRGEFHGDMGESRWWAEEEEVAGVRKGGGGREEKDGLKNATSKGGRCGGVVLYDKRKALYCIQPHRQIHGAGLVI